LLFIFIANYITYKEIKTVDEKLERSEKNVSELIEVLEKFTPRRDNSEDGGGGGRHNHDHGGQPSEFYEPDPIRKNEN
jgi:hypothetical protein